MIFDQNKEKFQTDTFSEEPPEKAKPIAGRSSAGPDGQEINPSVTFPAKPNEPANLQLDSSPVRTDEQAQPHPDPSLMRAAEQPQNAAAVFPMTVVEPAKPFPADKSATDSLMEVIVPAEKSKTEPVVSAVNQTNKKIIAVGGAKGGVGKSMLAANLAVGLALLGQKVVLADLDLGGADVHLYVGVKSLAKTWNDFLDKKVDSIKDILTPTAFKFAYPLS